MAYSVTDYDKLEPGVNMKIERRLYFHTENTDMSQFMTLPLERLQTMREENVAAEQAAFENLQEAAGAWDKQAEQTAILDRAIEYVKTPPVKHTSNQWETDSNNRDRQSISNMVYSMSYHVYERTRYDRETQNSVPVAWELTWYVRTNAPGGYGGAKIAGQDRKVYSNKADMEKYLAGRIKTYSHLFTEISPPIPQEYAKSFRVNNHLLPGYTVQGEEPNQPDRAAVIENGGFSISEPQNTEPRKEHENMNEPLNIQLMTHEMRERGDTNGAWLKLPATAEQLDNALARIGAKGSEQGKDFFISDCEPILHSLDYNQIASTPIDQLNYLAARLEDIEPVQFEKMKAAAVIMSNVNVHRLVEFTHNTDFFVHTPGVFDYKQLGENCLKDTEMINMPEEWKAAIDVEKLGLIVATTEKGVFTEHGYICPSGDEWKTVPEIPKEYQIIPKPDKPERGATRQDNPNIENDTIAAVQHAPAAVAAAPFVLVSDNPRDKLKEITGKLEAGIKGIFESEQYKTYLKTLSKFHNYSFNNCLLIAMQKPDATHVGGFNFWRDDMKRPVMKGEKGIKILAPSPFKTKKMIDAVDADGKPVFDKSGRRKKEETEITVPAFKVTTVFDVSQTDGEPMPQIGVNELTGSVDRYKDFFAALEKSSHVPIAFEAITSGAKGFYHQEEKRIAINEGMSELQNLKTAIHEIVHARLHDIDKNAPKNTPRPDKNTREVEAESIAYTVCQHYGLDTSDYSFGYVATWSGDKQLDTLKSSLDTIRKEAAAIINEVDKHFAELSQDREQTAEHQPGFEKWSEPTTPENAPDNPGVASDDVNAYLPKQDTPEMQEAKQGLANEAKATLQFFIDSDMKDHGEIRAATLEMIAVQGYEYRDGKLEEAPLTGGTFSIYQLKDGDETRDIRFEPFDNLKQAPDAANYNEVYTAPLKHGDTLDGIYMTFNLDRPEDFKGHSLAVSDVVVMNRDGQQTAHYIDGAGFKELPDFLTPKEQTLNREAESQGTPFYQAYTALTNEYPDNIVFTKVGDFYEVMGDKAVTVANEPGLGVTIAGRDVGLPERVPLVGVPAHSMDGVIKELNNRNYTVMTADKVSLQVHHPAPPLDLNIVADYMQKQYEYAQGADPNSQAATATVNVITRRLEQANDRIPDTQPQLKALLSHAAQSPDLPTLKERMNTLHTDFTQHYSTAVQNTIDTSGKAEPKTPAAPVKSDTPRAPKAPAQGENVAAIEAKVKAGEVINLSDLSDAIKKDKATAQTAPTTPKAGTRSTTQKGAWKAAQAQDAWDRAQTPKTEQPSIKEKIAAGKQELAAKKSAPVKTAAKNKNAGLGE